jgi:hypothetical protein
MALPYTKNRGVLIIHSFIHSYLRDCKPKVGTEVSMQRHRIPSSGHHETHSLRHSLLLHSHVVHTSGHSNAVNAVAEISRTRWKAVHHNLVQLFTCPQLWCTIRGCGPDGPRQSDSSSSRSGRPQVNMTGHGVYLLLKQRASACCSTGWNRPN